jgi:glycosyltransferase involved in cell wall biosynthesis
MYNCEKQISRVLEKIGSLEGKKRYFSEILIVDNGSKDKSIESAKKATKKVDIKTVIVRNKENVYLGGSHKVAFNYALSKGFDYVVVLHGDDQGDINDIIPYIESQEYKKYDSFLGCRFHPCSKLVNYSKFRILGNKIFNTLISIVVFRRLRDMGAGLNIYSTKYLSSKFYVTMPNNLTFNVYMLFYGIYVHSKFDFFHLIWREEDQTSNVKLVRQSLEILSIMFRYLFCKKRLFAKRENEFSQMKYEYEVLFENEI